MFRYREAMGRAYSHDESQFPLVVMHFYDVMVMVMALVT